MHRLTFGMLAALILASLSLCEADELAFPRTEQEIVDALSFHDGEVVYGGDTYVSSNGRVYKVIEGKRYRLRGLALMPADSLLPRAGALIQFDVDSAEIKPESYATLDRFGAVLGSRLADARICIVGHTDNAGEADYNQALSERRANAVTRYLIGHHPIDQAQILARGAGETAPIAANDTEAGRAKNRRVEFLRLE